MLSTMNCGKQDVMANIMKTTILTLIALTFLSSCRQQTRQNEQQTTNSEKNQTELVLTEKNTDQEPEKKVGQELFKSILDTISVKTISTDFLINNRWIYRRRVQLISATPNFCLSF